LSLVCSPLVSTWTALIPHQDDDHKVHDLGIEVGTELCRDLIAVGAPGLHLYTLNLEQVTYGIMKNLGYLKEH
jgi:methylenetetrahydrofolate reductase (NADPH)